MVALRWVFDELPPSGARRGGDPSEHAFRRDLSSFVREVVQNANDQAEFLPHVIFRLRELKGAALARYLEALSFETLRPHLEGAARSRGGAALARYLEALDGSGALLLLEVEDRNTRGLVGEESEGESHFRALCKDTLYSHKASASAGGSYGLGKSVLWTFSGLSTVIFNSILVDDARAADSPRLIGRVELPSHEATHEGARSWFTGSGWFGRSVRLGEGPVRAESVWSSAAVARAEALHVDRGPTAPPGTTIQIVGFRDPTRSYADAAELAKEMTDAALRYFWPAMVGDRKLRLSIQEQGRPRPMRVTESQEVAPFVACLAGREAPVEVLERGGDVAVRALPLEVPARRDGAPAVSAQVELLVRLGSEAQRGHPLAGHVAMFRGPGMVTRYWDCRGVSPDARPFHAVLIAGAARESEDLRVEQFLRAAEPPGHDEWRATPALRDAYRRGGPTALERLHRAVREALRELLAPRRSVGTEGPSQLQKRFPIGPRGAAGSAPSAFRFSRLEARFDGRRWSFSGRVEPVERSVAWRAIVRLRELGEDGSPLGTIAIARLDVDVERGATQPLVDGSVQIDAAPKVRVLAFTGTSEALGPSHDAAELSFEVTGAVER